MSAKVITITREFGSGGRTIGRMVANALGYDFYDWNLVDKIATETGFAKQFIEENGEEQGRFSTMLTSSSFGFNLNEQLFEAQSNVIFKLANKGNCVIVGRCADYLLRNDPNTLSCFIYANEESRKNRVVHEYGETDVPIDKRLKDKDKRRKAHYQYFTSRKWGRSFYYDLCIDTTRIPLDEAASLIVSAAQNFVPGVLRTDED
ncbi:cytidylate kinase-like family protein [Erysipelotrichaceae bacterium RD49]|nr:cytidylate kinase-like family protein [Erysipelotrichaceae bacterium RD49]